MAPPAMPVTQSAVAHAGLKVNAAPRHIVPVAGRVVEQHGLQIVGCILAVGVLKRKGGAAVARAGDEKQSMRRGLVRRCKRGRHRHGGGKAADAATYRSSAVSCAFFGGSSASPSFPLLL